MTLVLVADDDQNIRTLLSDTLADAGYDVIEAEDGPGALERAVYEHPDLILLDVWIPGMDGLEVLRRLKDTPGMEAIPVVLVTAMDPSAGELTAMELGVGHYITKPWDPGTVELAVKVALRESSRSGQGDHHNDALLIPTGNMALDRILEGGIPPRSLTLIEGVSSSGKSVVCYHVAYESLLVGQAVAFFTSDPSPKAIIDRMGSIGLEVSGFFREGKLNILPIRGSGPIEHASTMEFSTLNIERLPINQRTVIVDDITNIATHAHEGLVTNLFSECRQVCAEGRTIIMAAHSHIFSESSLARTVTLCDAHMNLKVEQIGKKLSNMLEVRKAHNAVMTRGNIVSFEVVSGVGMRAVPGSKVKV